MIDPTLLDGLSTRLKELEQRVAVLEREQSAQEPEPAAGRTFTSTQLSAAPMPQGSGFFSVMGKAMLGIAGAYLLRAFAESHWISEAVLAPFAIVYALAWLVAATRVSRSLARSTYACTSVLILVPMLWELTMRFKVLPPWADALALAAMAGVAFALARTAESAAVLRIANLAVAALSLALAIATHDNLPFLAVLLLLVGSCEYTVNCRKTAAVRWLMALAADLGVWMLICIYRGPHADYAEIGTAWLIAPGFALFAIAGVSTSFTACVHRERVRILDTVQTVIAFLLACCGLLYFGPPERFELLGVICLLLAAAVYVVVFTVLRDETDGRNRAVFAAWSAILLLAGSFFCVPAQWRTEWLGLSAVAATVASVRVNLLLLAVHGNAFMLAAAIASGLGAYAWQSLAGEPAGAPMFAVWFALICAVACYGIVQRGRVVFAQPASYIFVAIAAIAVAAMVAHGLISLAGTRFEPGPQHLALIRSFTLCGVALALAFASSIWRRRELTHIAYAVVVVEALKLIAEDLRHGHLAYVAASVCLFAITLIALPLVAKRALA